MILDILQRFPELIQSYEIQKFRITGNAYEIVLEIQLPQGNSLHVRDYMFKDESRKYSFHWQDNESNCKIRWDNAPHHQTTDTFPYHKHVGLEETVENSEIINLEKVLDYIKKYFET